MKAWYYLHENMELIHKRFEYDTSGRDFQESPFCKYYWLIDTEDRFSLWALLCEALALGAKKARVEELATLWGCTNLDAITFAEKAKMVLHPNTTGYLASWGDERKSYQAFTALEAISGLIGLGDIRGKKRRF